MWRAFLTSFLQGKNFETILNAGGKFEGKKAGEVKSAV
jgi:hypothetical protein